PYIAAIDDSKKGDFKLTSPHQLFSDLSYQVAFRQALLNNPDLQAIDFHIAKNKGTVKHYTFNKTEEGVTDTSLGKLAVTKFSYYKSKNEFIEFWLAKDYAYLPVYVQNVEGGKTLYKLSIDELSYGGKAIHAGEEVSLN
ncbi:MAG: DUF3108 domain-containing protein, partial [Sinobacterium sp.]|nr:DUF3108 domain-containing protein [Sinobacterium sp.]